MKKNRPKYDREFKISTVKLILNEGRSVKEVSKDLGIQPGTLRLWKREFEEKGEESVFPGLGKKVYSNSSELEFVKLKRRNRQLEMELDILKKAMPSH
ncbi:MAG: transposase [bacterium]